jgi:hypothetical protein
MRVGQGPEENGIDRAEDRRAGADAERQRQHADDGESRVAVQLAGSIAEVGGEGAERVLPSVRADPLAHDGRVAEFEAGCASRVFGGEAACLPGRDSLFEVLPHFVGNVVVGLAAMQKAAEPVGELTPEGHGSTFLAEQARDGGNAARPIRSLEFKLLFSSACELVELCASGVFCLPPLRIEPSGALQALQRRKQRTGVHLENASGNLLDPSGDSEAVQRLEAEGLQDQHVECALDDIGVGIVHGKTLAVFIMIVKM